MSGWRIRARAVPKSSAPADIIQDQHSYVVWGGGRGRASVLRIALADGATNAARSDVWARILVDAFAAGYLRTGQSSQSLSARAELLGQMWKASTPERPEAWYHRAYERRGSYAALLGAELTRTSGHWTWRALGIGDVELFVTTNEGQLVRHFPIARVDDFGSMPLLVSTNSAANQGVISRGIRARGDVPTGGSLWLASDALAQWILARAMDGEPPWDVLRAVSRSRSRFVAFVASLRDADAMADDDTTLILVERR